MNSISWNQLRLQRIYQTFMTSSEDCIESLRRIGQHFSFMGWLVYLKIWLSGDPYRRVELVGVHDHFGGRGCHPIKQSCYSHAKLAVKSGAIVLGGRLSILRYSLFISDPEMLWTVKTTIEGKVFLQPPAFQSFEVLINY